MRRSSEEADDPTVPDWPVEQTCPCCGKPCWLVEAEDGSEILLDATPMDTELVTELYGEVRRVRAVTSYVHPDAYAVSGWRLLEPVRVTVGSDQDVPHREALRSLHEAGYSNAVVAEVFDVDRTTILRRLKALGIEGRGPVSTEAARCQNVTPAEVRELRSRGVAVEDIVLNLLDADSAPEPAEDRDRAAKYNWFWYASRVRLTVDATDALFSEHVYVCKRVSPKVVEGLLSVVTFSGGAAADIYGTRAKKVAVRKRQEEWDEMTRNGVTVELPSEAGLQPLEAATQLPLFC